MRCIVLLCYVIKKSLTFDKTFWMKWNDYNLKTTARGRNVNNVNRQNVNKLLKLRWIFERTFFMPLQTFLLATRGPLRDPFYIKLVLTSCTPDFAIYPLEQLVKISRKFMKNYISYLKFCEFQVITGNAIFQEICCISKGETLAKSVMMQWLSIQILILTDTALSMLN